MDPKRALGRGLVKLRDGELGEPATRRLTAVINVLLYMEREGVGWDREISSYMNEVDGLANIVSRLESLSEGGRVQAVSLLAYIADAQEMIPEVSEQSLLNILTLLMQDKCFGWLEKACCSTSNPKH